MCFRERERERVREKERERVREKERENYIEKERERKRVKTNRVSECMYEKKKIDEY